MNAAEWSGRVGDVWAQEWRRTDRTFGDLAPHLNAAILAAAPAGSFAALDIGSGAGATSLALAQARPDARVTGVDLSPGLVAVARERTAGLANVTFIVGDAAGQAAAVRPDLMISRHGVMFFPDPQIAMTALHDAAAPGAGLVFSCFAPIEDNPWAALVVDAPAPAQGYMPGPFAFSDSDFTGALLARAGWRDAQPQRVDFTYRAGEGDDPAADALGLFARIGPTARALHDAGPAERESLEARLRARLEAQRHGDAVDFPAAAWIWTARA